MSTILIIAGAISAAVVGIGAVVWFSMKMTDRKEASGTGDWASPSSDGAGGYHIPILHGEFETLEAAE